MRKAVCAALGAMLIGGCETMKSEDGVYVVDSLANVGAYAKLGKNFAKEFLKI